MILKYVIYVISRMSLGCVFGIFFLLYIKIFNKQDIGGSWKQLFYILSWLYIKLYKYLSSKYSTHKNILGFLEHGQDDKNVSCYQGYDRLSVFSLISTLNTDGTVSIWYRLTFRNITKSQEKLSHFPTWSIPPRSLPAASHASLASRQQPNIDAYPIVRRTNLRKL